eukprot:Skav223929  [mRNA]  locus=scaffold2593:425766:431664:+ [translate_table: standard]
MSDDCLGLFWALLEMAKFEEIKITVPENFDWSVLHPVRKTTILVEAVRALWSTASRMSISYGDAMKALDQVDWLIRRGASYSQQGGRTDRAWVKWKLSKPDLKVQVPLSKHSCVSIIQAWKHELSHKEDWEPDRKFLEECLVRIARASSKRQTRRRASVDEGIVEIWEKCLHDAASHDLTIETADGQVTAHSCMLQAASPVVQAMLAAPMREGKSQQIQLKDTSRSAVTLFLEALYTCSLAGDLDYQTVLSGLDLAHRWQVEVVVAILADLLRTMITEDNFLAIAEHAVLKHLDTLKQACRKFGFECAAIRSKINQGQLPKVVQDFFQVVEKSPSKELLQQHQPVEAAEPPQAHWAQRLGAAAQKHLGSRATVALLEQYLILTRGPSPMDSQDLIRQSCKKWLSKERRFSTTSFVRTGGGVLKQRRRAKRCDVGKKRSQYIKKKPARDGPLRGLTGAEAVGLSRAPEESKAQASRILDEMSPPKSRRKE